MTDITSPTPDSLAEGQASPAAEPSPPTGDIGVGLLRRGSLGQPALNQAVSRLIGEEDTMELHTREAMLLFLGKAPDEERRWGVPGARHAAGALRQIFVLTAHDNPYADLVLIDVDGRVRKLKDLIHQIRERQIKRLDTLARMGLSYSIVRAQTPQSVSLGYHSPYGYMMSTVIVLFDECVRVLKSAERRDLISRAEQHEMLFEIKHAVRSLFDAAIRAQRVLCVEQMRRLSRSDFLPETTDQDAPKRVLAARQILGQLPEDVFSGRASPRHSMRRERITADEQRLLDQVARQVAEPSPVADASADVAGLVQ